VYVPTAVGVTAKELPVPNDVPPQVLNHFHLALYPSFPPDTFNVAVVPKQMALAVTLEGLTLVSTTVIVVFTHFVVLQDPCALR
jgi:hypothetical protein